MTPRPFSQTTCLTASFRGSSTNGTPSDGGDALTARGASHPSTTTPPDSLSPGSRAASFAATAPPLCTPFAACATDHQRVHPVRLGSPGAHLDAYASEKGRPSCADATASADRRAGQPAPEVQSRELPLQLGRKQGGGCGLDPARGSQVGGHEEGHALEGTGPDDCLQLLPSATGEAAGAGQWGARQPVQGQGLFGRADDRHPPHRGVALGVGRRVDDDRVLLPGRTQRLDAVHAAGERERPLPRPTGPDPPLHAHGAEDPWGDVPTVCFPSPPTHSPSPLLHRWGARVARLRSGAARASLLSLLSLLSLPTLPTTIRLAPSSHRGLPISPSFKKALGPAYDSAESEEEESEEE